MWVGYLRWDIWGYYMGFLVKEVRYDMWIIVCYFGDSRLIWGWIGLKKGIEGIKKGIEGIKGIKEGIKGCK